MNNVLARAKTPCSATDKTTPHALGRAHIQAALASRRSPASVDKDGRNAAAVVDCEKRTIINPAFANHTRSSANLC